jgi:hypothetical protein
MLHWKFGLSDCGSDSPHYHVMSTSVFFQTMTIRRPLIRRATASLRLLLVVLGLITTAQAQYRFDHWTETGLPQNIITAIRGTRAHAWRRARR